MLLQIVLRGLLSQLLHVLHLHAVTETRLERLLEEEERLRLGHLQEERVHALPPNYISSHVI